MSTGYLRTFTMLAATVAALVAVGLLLITARPAQAATFNVTKTEDTADGSCTSADCSLREAIIAANNSAKADKIIVPAGTYTLTIPQVPSTGDPFGQNGDLNIYRDVSIIGAGADVTTISGGDTSRVLSVGDNFTNPKVAISGVTIADGNAASPGEEAAGGIFNSGKLTLNKSAVRDNRADLQGGGILNEGSASLKVTDSTISDNKARQGGGIYNSGSATGGGSVTLTNSTISGNEARGTNSGGGGIASFAREETIKNTTIAFNAADGPGGGIFNGGGSPEFKNTIVANNTSVNFLSDNCTFSSTSLGNNLSGDDSCAFGKESDKENTDPKLDPLQNNGGTTDTHTLGSGSPAINAGGKPFPAKDQRGVKRPQEGASDIGAVEMISGA